MLDPRITKAVNKIIIGWGRLRGPHYTSRTKAIDKRIRKLKRILRPNNEWRDRI